MNSYEQTVQTQSKLLLKKQFDQGLHCLSFIQHFLTHHQVVRWTYSKFGSSLETSWVNI